MANNLRNFSHTSNFIFGTNLFGEEATYLLQSVNLPGMSMSHVQVNHRSIMGNIQGDTTTFNDLSLEFIVDEELVLWKQIANHFKKMREQDKGTGDLINEYAWLEIHDDNSRKVLKLDFHGALFESFDDLIFNTTSDDDVLTLSGSMKYDYYTIDDGVSPWTELESVKPEDL